MVREYPISVVSIVVTTIITLLAFDYIDCHSLTCWSISIWDALSEGRLLDYSEVTFENKRGAYHDGDVGGFLQLLPWGVWNLPIWFAHSTPGNYDIDTPACMIWTRLFLILCLLLASYYVKKLSFTVTGDRTISEYAFLLCFSSSTAFMSVMNAGQNEIMYIVSFLASIYYYQKGHKILPACLMIYALGFLPLLILPLVIILLMKKCNFVKSIFIAMILLVLGMILLGIGGSAGVEGTGAIYSDWLRRTFYDTWISTGEGDVSFLMVAVIAILAYCVFKKSEDSTQTAIVCVTLFFVSMLCFCFQSFYRFFVCFPPIILSLMVLYKSDPILFKVGLILYTLINFSMIVVACQDYYCWNPGINPGILSELLGNVSEYNFIWLLNYGDRILYPQLLFSAMFAICILFCVLLIKKPTITKEINIDDRALLELNTVLCPLVLVLVYFITFLA